MESLVKKTLNEKGINISDHILNEVTSRWTSVNNMKNAITNAPASTNDLALRNIPRGDYVEQ